MIYKSGNVYFDGSVVDIEFAMPELRSKVPELGAYESINLETGYAKRGGRKNGAPYEAAPLAVDFSFLAENPAWQEAMDLAWREVAYMSRLDFCMSLFDLGILPADEVAEAARGKWPASFEPFLAAVDDERDRVEIAAIWGDTRRVRRNNQIVNALGVQVFGDDSDESLDDMFGRRKIKLFSPAGKVVGRAL